MSAPRKICVDKGLLRWLLFNEYVYQSPISTSEVYHHDDVVRELVEALEFYADRKFTGYEVDVSDYGLSMSKGEIIMDEGDIARAALAKIAQEDQR